MNSTVAANILRTISTPRRIEIITMLLAEPEPLSPTFIGSKLGLPSGPTAQNLTILASCGVILRHTAGTRASYSANHQLLTELATLFQDPSLQEPTP